MFFIKFTVSTIFGLDVENTETLNWEMNGVLFTEVVNLSIENSNHRRNWTRLVFQENRQAKHFHAFLSQSSIAHHLIRKTKALRFSFVNHFLFKCRIHKLFGRYFKMNQSLKKLLETAEYIKFPVDKLFIRKFIQRKYTNVLQHLFAM